MGGGSPPCWKSVAQKIQSQGKADRRDADQGAPNIRGCPSPGGRARGTATVRPWGGRPDPSLIELIPNIAQHEAAQGNYNINELIMNRRSGGLFAASGYLSRFSQVAHVRSADRRPGRPHRGPTPPGRKGRARSQWLIACERAHRSRSRIDHVSGLGCGQLSSYKGATDSENVRARQQGTHARPAAGGVSGQARTVSRQLIAHAW